MGAENLGYLAQFLGGMQQGKLMRQKKELSAAQLEARKAEAEQRKYDRAATANYRDQQLALQRANLGATIARNERDALGLDELFKLGTATRDKIANVVATRTKELDAASTPKEYNDILEGIRSTVEPDISSIRTLAKDPNIAKRFPGFSSDKLEGLWLAGVPEYAKNRNVSPGMPNFKARYKPVDAVNRFNLNVKTLRDAGEVNPQVYAQATFPAYDKIIKDLEGVEGAEDYALATLGPIPMFSVDETRYFLKTGRMPRAYATPDQMGVTDVSAGDTGEMYDQYGRMMRFGDQPAVPEGSMVPQDFEYYSQKYPQLFTPDLGEKPVSDEQGQPNYVRTGSMSMPAGISVKTQTDMLMRDPRVEKAKAEAAYSKAALPERLRKLGLENEKATQALEIGELDKKAKTAKAFMEELKAENFPAKLAAELEVQVTTALRNKAGVITAIKNWESNAQKNYGMAVSTASANLMKANATYTNNQNISALVNNPEYATALTTYLNDPSPTAVIPGNIAIEIGSAGVAAARDLKLARKEFDDAVKARDTFNQGGVLKVRNVMERMIGSIGGTSSQLPRIGSPSRTSTPAPARSGGGGGGGARPAPPATGGGLPRVARPRP